ncbi:MAG: cytochrome c oxidase subunit II [Vicinamibacterales bacterium]
MQFLHLPSSFWTVVGALNRVYRTVLMLPPQASSVSSSIDALHYLEITIYTAIAVVFMTTTVVFLIRFRRRGDADRPPDVQASGLVGAYALGMFGLFVVFWAIGQAQFTTLRSAPRGAADVYVTGKQWTWKFAYADGGGSVDVLYVPLHQPIRLLLTSRDVIHSFWVPAFRIKQDAVPGTYTSVWFEATTPGAFQVMCAEMCGAGHAGMWAQIVVLDGPDYSRWKQGDQPAVSPASIGLPTPDAETRVSPRAFETRVEQGRRAAAAFACLKCHTIDGQRHIGPTWLGVYDSEEPLRDGTRVRVDEAYMTRSMMDPAVEVVNGFDPVMPSYQGLLTPADTAAIIEFIKSLRDASQPHVVAPLPDGPIDGLAPAPRGVSP